MLPWLFLSVTVIGSLFTLNAYLPQRRTGPLIIPSFFAGWLTAELPLHHMGWQFLATVVFVALGALEAWPGQVALGLTAVSWLGLFGLLRVAHSAEPVIEAALIATLGPRYREEIDPDVARGYALGRDSTGTTGTPIDSGPPAHLLNPFDLWRGDVAVTQHIDYVGSGVGSRHHLDVYAPRRGTTNAPVLLQVHGGGWMIGDKGQQGLPLMHHLASRGWVCVSANYRLSPRATWPEHLIDLKCAIRWIRDEIEAFGGDPNFIAATGGSAGGHLSSLVGLTANDPEYQPGFETVDTSVRAVVPFYGVYDLSNHYDLQATFGIRGLSERMILKKKYKSDPEAFRRASPMHRMTADAPPFFVIHGSNDSLAAVEEARHFAHALGQISKNPVAYAELPGAQHAFDIFHSKRASVVVRAVDRFLSWTHSRYLAQP